MKHAKAVLLVIFMLSGFSLSAKPYVGVTQSLMSTGLEVGLLSRTFEQNLAFSVPTSNPSLQTPNIQTTLVYRFSQLSPLVLGLGLKARAGWETTVGYEIGVGVALSLSYEFLFSRGILFIEGSYLPWITKQGSAVDASIADMMSQQLRFGYRQVL